jgi:hypothetical protein
MKLTAFLLFSIYTSCLVPDPKTHIVVTAEQGGCADTAHSTMESIQTCLYARRDLALQLSPECEYQAQHTSSAHWGDSTEGRVCRAVVPVAANSILTHFQAIN